MYPVNKDLAEELHQLSGWEYDLDGSYSLSLMLRKLPVGTHITKTKNNEYIFVARGRMPNVGVNAETAEDAACKLCIELFKQGVLI